MCDDEWHHYAINVNFPEVELTVDGDKWIDERDNPEIIDDWPLHPAADITTKITIGACWQGKEDISGGCLIITRQTYAVPVGLLNRH